MSTLLDIGVLMTLASYWTSLVKKSEVIWGKSKVVLISFTISMESCKYINVFPVL